MVRVGILGFAHGHVMAYGGRWVQMPQLGVKIVAGWDHDRARAESSCATLGGAEVMNSAEALVSRGDIDAVVVSSETLYHAQLCELAAAAGKAIICYKPLALTLADADRIVAAVEKYGVLFTLGYQMRVDPQNIKIKELIEDGTIGDIHMYRRRHGLATHTWPGFENTWHADPKLNRDIFADDSSHPIDMLNWIFGVPETVMAELSTMCNPKVPNDNGVALFKYKNGMIAEISAYFTCSASEITTEVYGSRGSIQQYFGDGPSTRLPHGTEGLKYFVEGSSDWTPSGIPSPAGHGERIAAQAAPFAEFLSGKRPPVCSVYEARDSLKMVLACYLSSNTGERVRLDDSRLYDI
jgi:predicted dehydrogenase